MTPGKILGTVLKIVIPPLFLYFVWNFVGYYFAGPTPDIFTFNGTTFTVSSHKSKAYATYTAGEKTVLTGNLFQYTVLPGTVQRVGQVLSMSYLDPAGNKIFQSLYGGLIHNCPASFLNTYTKVVVLYAATNEIADQLYERESKLSLNQQSIPFAFEGRPITFTAAQMADGRPLMANFGDNSLFLVEKIIRF